MTKKQDIHREGIVRELPVKLAASQLLEIAISKANAEAQLEQDESKLEDIKREWGDKLKEQKKQIAAMGSALRTREQRQPIDCYERWRDGATLEVVRTDTGEVIDVRVATLRDKQGELDGTTDTPEAAADGVETGFPEDDEDEKDDAGDEQHEEKPKKKRAKR